MKHLYSIVHAVLHCLVLIEMLGPPVALAQQADLSAMNDVTYYAPDAKVLGAKFAFQALLPFANATHTPSEARQQVEGIDRWMQSLTLDWDGSRANSWVAYISTTPTGQHAPGVANNIFSEYWTSSVTSGSTVYLTKKKTTAASLTTDWEIRGQEQRTKGTPSPLGQSFTMEWGVAHLLTLDYQRTRLLAFGVAGYDAWLGSNNCALLPGGLPARGEPFSMHAVGVQTNFILPAKNLSFSFKYEPEYLAHPPTHGRMIMFGASWTW
jgi:hypothetical protein